MQVVDFLSEEEKHTLFGVIGSTKTTDSKKDTVSVSADIKLVHVVARVYLTKTRREHIAAHSRMELTSNAGLNVAKKPIVEIGSLE